MERQIKINNWRIVKIDELLQSGRCYTAKEIAEELHVSEQTIRGYVQRNRDKCIKKSKEDN